MTLLGGWWCSAADVRVVPETNEKQKSHANTCRRCCRALTATPRYPSQAIREAKQGRVVSCFLVDADGYIVEPELIELSDEVFRQPILEWRSRARVTRRASDETRNAPELPQLHLQARRDQRRHGARRSRSGNSSELAASLRDDARVRDSDLERSLLVNGPSPVAQREPVPRADRR